MFMGELYNRSVVILWYMVSSHRHSEKTLIRCKELWKYLQHRLAKLLLMSREKFRLLSGLIDLNPSWFPFRLPLEVMFLSESDSSVNPGGKSPKSKEVTSGFEVGDCTLLWSVFSLTSVSGLLICSDNSGVASFERSRLSAVLLWVNSPGSGVDDFRSPSSSSLGVKSSWVWEPEI